MLKPIQALLLAAILSAAACANSASQRRCTPQEATEADATVDHLDSWQKIESAFSRLGHCDSGSIAEGTSEAVARVLVDQWQSLPTLVSLTKADSRLRKFVLRHVDSTLDTDDLERISWLSAKSCPQGAASLCKELKAAASRALDGQAD